MAGYFSNHSQSRFLANSTTGTGQTAASSVVNAPPPQSTTPSTSSRPRAPSSKHFSTSVSTSGDEKLHAKEKAPSQGSPNGAVHPLRNTYVRTLICIASVCVLIGFLISSWVFWFRQQRHPGNKITNYEEGIKKISAFSSVSRTRCILYTAPAHVLVSCSGRIILVHMDTSPSAIGPVTDHRLSIVSHWCPEACLGRPTQSFGG